MQAQFTLVDTANVTQPIDPTDVMTVQRRDLDHALHILIDEGHALVLFHGADDAIRRAFETAFWRTFKGPDRLGSATLLRFWALVDALQHKRLNTMFLDRGFAMIDHLVAGASVQRLNVCWGFNPQRIVSAVIASEREAWERASWERAALATPRASRVAAIQAVAA